MVTLLSLDFGTARKSASPRLGIARGIANLVAVSRAMIA